MESSPQVELEDKIKELPEEKQQMVKKLQEKVEDLKRLVDEQDGWSEAINKDGYIVHTKKTDNGLNCVRGQGPIGFSAAKVVEFISTDGNTTKYDSQYKEGKVIEDLGLGINASIGYSRYKGATLVSDRDFCMISATFKEDDGKYVIIATSVEHPDCPDVKKVVRADLIIGGWIITPDATDPENKCYAYYITQTNPKGSVPKMFVNQVSKNQGMLPREIYNAMKKE